MKKLFTVLLYILIATYVIYPMFHALAWGYEWNEFFVDALRSATVVIISASVLYFSSKTKE
jgi:hypothetical protein